MVEGVSYEINGVKILLFSEFYSDNQRAVAKLSELWKDNLIFSGYATDKIYMAMALNGKVLDKRAKIMLTREDAKYYKKGDIEDFKVFKFNGITILPIICYEIVFSNLWRRIKEKVDVIVHNLSDPMWNEDQKLRWTGLQNYMVRYYKCDLVCCVGNSKKEDKNKLDISRVVKYAEL